MSSKKGSLGKGLGALFGENNNSIIEATIVEEKEGKDNGALNDIKDEEKS